MHFHEHGYVSEDPRIRPAAGYGLNRSDELPDEMDVLIVGTGPAGMLAAAQLSYYPEVNTRIIERREGRLEIGQADGIQARSVETFQAFGFASEIIDEAFWLTEMCFWKPDPTNPENIIRTARTPDDPSGISEFPHLIVNQARVLDGYAEAARRAPGRITPDYGIKFLGLSVDREQDYPVEVQVEYVAGPRKGEQRTVRAKYVVGCDGAHSRVRDSIGRVMSGDVANHAWGVMDVLANTDFPDIRTKCAINSKHGQILHIPREGGHLFRMYVDLGEVPLDDDHKVRDTPIEEIIRKANDIITPYTLDVKSVAWNSVYEVGHRLTDHFDDVDTEDRDRLTPRVFITGDACHTHSAKAGQGMNVSMQDGFNISWKLGQVLSGRSPETLLHTYSDERQEVAKNLIDFDKEWSTLMATPTEELPDPTYLEDFYVKTAEFPAGFLTEYRPSMVTGGTEHQELAAGFPVGKRFKSAKAMRVCDANPLHIGHQAVADGRWRLYAFADRPACGEHDSKLSKLAEWLETSADSPFVKYRREGDDIDAQIEPNVIYQQDTASFDCVDAPAIFRPKVGKFGLEYWEKIYATIPDEDIFEARELSRDGVVVIVRPDQYVAAVLPLDDVDGIAAYFDAVLTTN
ncbi:FAD-binding monooxygenase [Auritidibacter ignavus]|uniref:FAD-binding monooxygenase n=1 Tax=Auritidibacter ignavus TaxID=678932 RepID=UPI000F02E156|nr:FAD-binding monooxygenase [Auritidibacter ignavus]NIH72641.1 phenol 2-monooxygenase [Auritidibacter ignavus]RMX22957.1 3-hydroxybenzoate 4-monooxygenase [Auritidibacter ignavus]